MAMWVNLDGIRVSGMSQPREDNWSPLCLIRGARHNQMSSLGHQPGAVESACKVSKWCPFVPQELGRWPVQPPGHCSWPLLGPSDHSASRVSGRLGRMTAGVPGAPCRRQKWGLAAVGLCPLQDKLSLPPLHQGLHLCYQQCVRTPEMLSRPPCAEGREAALRDHHGELEQKR